MINPEPDYEAALGLINHLPINDLKQLLNTEDKLIELIKDLPQIKNLVDEKDILLISIKSLAQDNISLQPKLNEGKQILILKHDEHSILQEEVNNLKLEKSKLITKQAPEDVQALLKTAAKNKEEDAENLLQSFLSNDDQIIQVDTFIPNYISEKTVAHCRNIKADKMSELIKMNKNSQNMFPSAVVTTPWATPYPTQLPNMPIPQYSIQ